MKEINLNEVSETIIDIGLESRLESNTRMFVSVNALNEEIEKINNDFLKKSTFEVERKNIDKTFLKKSNFKDARRNINNRILSLKESTDKEFDIIKQKFHIQNEINLQNDRQFDKVIKMQKFTIIIFGIIDLLFIVCFMFIYGILQL